MAKKYVKIGTLLRTVGTNGEVKVDITNEFLEDLLASDHVFVVENGSFIPYFIESIRETNHILIKMEEVDDPESASALNLRDIYLREENIHSETFFKQLEKEELTGYSVYNGNELIGTISSIELFPQQIMALILYKGKMIYVPLADELIEKVDKTTSAMYMLLPEGLLDI
ncbi:MAG: hypothetical protein H7X99_09140 [Saprospiraceae bacterium]|nr:hypothetical protein [Saprospiraceae bacterium]